MSCIALDMHMYMQTGPNFDYVPPGHAHEEGNDDLGFWGFAVIAAAEMNFPQPRDAHYSGTGLGEMLAGGCAWGERALRNKRSNEKPRVPPSSRCRSRCNADAAAAEPRH